MQNSKILITTYPEIQKKDVSHINVYVDSLDNLITVNNMVVKDGETTPREEALINIHEGKDRIFNGTFTQLTKRLSQPIIVVESKNGTMDTSQVFYSGDEAEAYFTERIKASSSFVTDEDIQNALEDGYYEDKNGVEINLVWPNVNL